MLIEIGGIYVDPMTVIGVLPDQSNSGKSLLVLENSRILVCDLPLEDAAHKVVCEVRKNG